MRIGSLADQVGTSTSTLRFYERQGLLPAPERTPGGYRDYPPAAVQRVKFIQRCRAAGLTLAQAGAIVRTRDAGQAPCAQVLGLLESELGDLDARIEALAALRRRVGRMREEAARADPADCDPARVCTWL